MTLAEDTRCTTARTGRKPRGRPGAPPGPVGWAGRVAVAADGRRPATPGASLPGMGLMLSQQPEADALLDRDPLALVIGMVLDQQIPLEKAFSSPWVLAERLGHVPDAAEIAGMDEDTLVAIFSKPPALHRFPGSMAKRVQAMCRAVAEQYDNDVTNVWTTAADGKQLLQRLGSAAGVRQAEGADLHRPARQAVRRHAARLAGGRGGVRPGRCRQVGRRHHRRRVPGSGPRVQEAAEGRRQSRGVGRRGH